MEDVLVLSNASCPDPAEDDGSQIGLLIGVTIVLSTSFVQSLGLTVQRKSHVLNGELPKEKRRSACRRPLWHLGFDTYILANVTGSLFAIGTLPVIIMAPLSACTLVFNAFFARILLGELFTAKAVTGTILILLGAVLITFGVVPVPDHSLEDLVWLYHRPVFIVYFSVVGAIVVLLLVACRIGGRMSRQMSRDDRDPVFGLLRKEFRTLLGVTYGSVSGMIAAQSLLFAKSAVELLKVTIRDGENQFARPFSWFILVATAITALLQLYYLNKGLSLCGTVLLVPLSFCTYNLSVIFNGLVYYNQWGCLSWWQILLMILGVCILLWGVLVLSWRNGTTAPVDKIASGEESLLLGSDLERQSDADGDDDDDDDATVRSVGSAAAGGSSVGGGDGGGGGGALGNHDKTIRFCEMLEDTEEDEATEKTSLLGDRRKRNRGSASINNVH